MTPSPVCPVANRYRVRRARQDDIPSLGSLVRFYAEQGILLPRTEEEFRETIRDFRVIRSEGRVIGCAVLHFYTAKVAELRSLAVLPAHRGEGLGRHLVEALLEEARVSDLDMVFALTYATEFFARLGFVPIDREWIPWKAWKDCLACPKRECCDEIAVARWLKPTAVCGPPPPFSLAAGVLPVLRQEATRRKTTAYFGDIFQK